MLYYSIVHGIFMYLYRYVITNLFFAISQLLCLITVISLYKLTLCRLVGYQKLCITESQSCKVLTSIQSLISMNDVAYDNPVSLP